MALRYLLDQASYDALSDALKTEYIAGEKPGEFKLDVTGMEDTGALKRANERLKTDKTDLQRRLTEAEGKLENAPDVSKINADHEAKTKKLSDFAEKTLKTSKAMELATKISTVPDLLAEKIAARISVDMSGDEPKAVVLGADGKPSDMNFDALSKEFVDNPAYKSIIIGSKGSGGGAAPKTPATPFGGGAPTGDKTPDLSRASGADLAARIQAKKAAQQQGE